jgi:hypothetical protein
MLIVLNETEREEAEAARGPQAAESAEDADARAFAEAHRAGSDDAMARARAVFGWGER